MTVKQSIIVDAIKYEMNSGKPFDEAVAMVLKSKQFNNMDVKRIAEKYKKDLQLLQNWIGENHGD